MVIITDANGNPTEVAGNFLTSEDLESISNTVSLLDNKIAEFSQRVNYTESVETVYDMFADTTDLHLNKQEGIQGGVSITKNLNKYKRLRFVVQFYPASSTNTGGYNDVFELDLTSNSASNWKIATAVFAYPVSVTNFDTYGSTWKAAVWYNLLTNELKFSFGFGATNNTDYNQTTNAIITKIEGIY